VQQTFKNARNVQFAFENSFLYYSYPSFSLSNLDTGQLHFKFIIAGFKIPLNPRQNVESSQLALD